MTQLMAAVGAMCRAPEWHWARIAVVVFVAINILGLNVWAWRDKAQLAAKQAQINQALLSAYPQTTVVVDPIAQMSKALALDKAKHGGLDDKGLEAQLASKATASKAYSQIDFAGGDLKLTELKASAP